MKRIICLLLALLLMTTLLTSCDIGKHLVNLGNFIDDAVGKDTESTTESTEETTPTEPEATTPEAEVTTPETEVTTPDSGTVSPEPQINYGTLNYPVSTTYAHNVCANLADGESSAQAFYIKGEVTKIGQTGNYYKNVYFTDGTTEMLIYTINMGDGITGFAVGDTITAYGYVKNYKGTIEMATYNDSVLVYAVKVESDNTNQGGSTPDNNEQGGSSSTHLYTDFTADEKALFNSIIGGIIPFIPNSEYYVEEYDEAGEAYISFYTFGNTQTEFDAYRTLFSSYTFDGTETDDYGDTWYLYSKGNVCVDMSFYYYESEYVVDIYAYILDEDEGENEGDDEIDPDDSEINYGTLNTPVSTTYAHTVCANLANNESSANAFYVKGTVTKIGQTGSYYKNVYFTDGTTEMLIYTINMSDGITGFAVGDTIVAYGYIKNYSGTIEMATYNSSVYVYVVKVETEGGNQGSTDTPNHPYTAFTSSEKELFNDYFGFVIPFLSNSEYYVEEYTYEGEVGINFYTYGNTASEFSAYRSLFSSYTNDGTDTDEYGDMWYYYSKGNVYVDMSRYADDEGNYVVDIYVYTLDGNSGDDDSDDTDTDFNSNLLTNDGKGLPEDDDGIYDVDFTKGEYVQNVTDQAYYLDGCPTTGSPAVLVIPVEFSDVTAQSKGYSIANIEKIFLGTDLPYYSVYNYFYTSSYGKLDLDITVVDSWFRPSKSSSYYADQTEDYYGEEMTFGAQLVLDEALAYLATVMDLSRFDSDNNGIIDAVIMVNTLNIVEEDFYWAYRSWNMYTDENNNFYEYDNVSANDFVWISYEFMFESYDENGNANYNHSNPLNSYSYIHEFSHVLGSDDYYDTEYQNHPLNNLDVMDAMTGDHNPYSKFNFGWITSSKLIVTDETVTVNLNAFAKNGDTIIIANNWDETLGAYQEYYVIMYYTMTGLNANGGGYFARDGVVVYHVNSTLCIEEYDGESFYIVYNTNTSSGDYGTEDNLIEFVKSSNDTYTYIAGDTPPTITDDTGSELIYTFVIDAITEEYATITFTKNN